MAQNRKTCIKGNKHPAFWYWSCKDESRNMLWFLKLTGKFHFHTKSSSCQLAIKLFKEFSCLWRLIISPKPFLKSTFTFCRRQMDKRKTAYIMLQADKEISDHQMNTPGRQRMIKGARYKITDKWDEIFLRAIILNINIIWSLL